jgi:uncharacterized protein (TIRG00374 family)
MSLIDQKADGNTDTNKEICKKTINNKKKRSWGKSILALITFAVAGFVFYIFITELATQGLMIDVLRSLRPGWICAAVFCMFLYWLVEGKILHLFIRRLYRRSSYLYSFRITMIGQLYNAITPFSSGGQPMQFYYLTKDGYDPGDAASIQALKFIIYQITLVLYCLIMLIWRLAFFKTYLSSWALLTLVGFFIHAAVIVALIFFAKSPAVTSLFLQKGASFLRKIKLIRIEDLAEKIEKQLKIFHESLNLIDRNIKLRIYAYTLSALQLSLLFIIPYLIYRSLGLQGASPADMLAAQVLANLVYSFAPIPGAVGAAEGSFYLFFNIEAFAWGSFLVPAILLWRIITYYFCIIFGGIALFFSGHKRPVKRWRRRDAGKRGESGEKR